MNESTLLQQMGKLYHFFVAAQEGKLSTAAKKLGLSQPALSLSIKALEEVLGTSLLQRHRAGVRVTKAGKQLLESLRPTISSLKATQRKLAYAALSEDLILRIGTKEPLAIHLWPEFLVWLSKSGSELHAIAESAELHVDKSNRFLINQMQDGQLDLLLLVEPDVPPSFVRSKLFRFTYHEYRPGKKAPAVVRERHARSSVLLCYSDAILSANRSLQNSLPAHANLRVSNVQSLDAAREMACRGLGTAVLPRWVVKDSLEQEILEEVPDEESFLGQAPPEAQIYYCVRSSARKTPEERTVRTLATELKKFCETF